MPIGNEIKPLANCALISSTDLATAGYPANPFQIFHHVDQLIGQGFGAAFSSYSAGT
jgi:hypothetical protein